jgi:hypothetical protein
MIELNELLKNEFGNKPYINHCQDVVTILQYADGVTDEAIQAAWLHDTVEDTAYTLDQVQHEFGDTVAKYVWYLTNVPKFVGRRKKRAAIDNDRLIHAPRLVKEIKCADIISNCLNIAELDTVFAETYLLEKKSLLMYFKRQIDVNKEYGYHFEHLTLLPLAIKVVEDGLNLLNNGATK